MTMSVLWLDNEFKNDNKLSTWLLIQDSEQLLYFEIEKGKFLLNIL